MNKELTDFECLQLVIKHMQKIEEDYRKNLKNNKGIRMKTDIWHSKNESPESGELVFGKSGGYYKSEIYPRHIPEDWCTADNYIKEHQEQSSKIERLENIVQGISDYVFGNGLAVMSQSVIEKLFVQNDIKVEFLERGKTKITTVENNNAE